MSCSYYAVTCSCDRGSRISASRKNDFPGAQIDCFQTCFHQISAGILLGIPLHCETVVETAAGSDPISGLRHVRSRNAACRPLGSIQALPCRIS